MSLAEAAGGAQAPLDMGGAGAASGGPGARGGAEAPDDDDLALGKACS